jgi:hypothetical protein
MSSTARRVTIKGRPVAYYTARGEKAASVAPARNLFDRMRDEEGVKCVLASWDPERRVVDSMPRG